MRFAVTLAAMAMVKPAAAGPMDALIGDWDLNFTKSTFRPSPPMKKYTMRVIAADAGRLRIKSDWIEADGTPGHVEYSTAFDGQPIAVDGYPIADAVSVKMVNATTWTCVWTRNGRVVEREIETLSPDGRTFREMDQGQDERGRRFRNRLVFERPESPR